INKYKNYFDSVIYINVFEHIEDDSEELAHVFRVLKKNGYVIIFVPALSWLYSNFDKNIGHFRRYNKKDIQVLIREAGFQVIQVKYFDFIGIFFWYIVFVLCKKTLTGNNVFLYDKLIVPCMNKIENIIEPVIGKNLLVIAKKNNYTIASECKNKTS
ncbi:MAG: methyltransferase domain-containing protein, partial [Desulfococcaceae bacterium]|nr:methyltransferase domain-containing protein [Desulfococcaceae bacterium]